MNQGEGIDQAVTRDVGDDWAAGTPREGEQVVAPQEDDAAANEQGLAGENYCVPIKHRLDGRPDCWWEHVARESWIHSKQ